MDQLALTQLIEMGLAEKFWNELNHESIYPVEFLDAALCFASLRDLSRSQGSGNAAFA